MALAAMLKWADTRHDPVLLQLPLVDLARTPGAPQLLRALPGVGDSPPRTP